MPQKDRQEQLEIAREIQKELLESLDKTYLDTFEKLSKSGLGQGIVARLTQLILLSKEAAINTLSKGVE